MYIQHIDTCINKMIFKIVQPIVFNFRNILPKDNSKKINGDNKREVAPNIWKNN